MSDMDVTLEETVVRLLLDRHATLAVSESCTGGMVAERITSVAGSSACFEGGVVAYSNEAKTALLGIDAGLIEEHGAVSRPVAEALAEGARFRFGSDFGVGITGIAGPGGGSIDKPVGTVFVALVFENGSLVNELHLDGDRRQIRELSCDAVMRMLIEQCSGVE